MAIKLFPKLRAAIRWSRAIDSVAASNYREALDLLESVETHFNDYPEYFLLRGFVEYALADNQVAINDLRKAIQYIRKSKKYNSDEKNYLIRYAAHFIEESLKTINVDIRPSFEIDDADLSFDISKVANHLKGKFPIDKL